MKSKKETTANAKIQQLRDAQQKRIERVVCSGGGAKGVVYAGSYKAMKDTGMLKGVKEFSGASAGAITAAFMAVGMPTDIFREKLLTTNLKDLMGTGVGKVLGGNPAGVAFITKDGKPLENFIRENINATVKNFLLDPLTDLDTVASKDPDLQKLKIKMNNPNPKITFGDLALLNRYFPEQFKKLTIPAAQFPGGEVQIFNAELTPDVEIAMACRASSSIPVILEPVEIIVNDQPKKFVDGGVYDNLPTDNFDGQEPDGTFIKNTKPEQTLVVAFGEGLENKKNQVFQALYGKRWDEAVTDETIARIFKAAIKVSEKMIEDGGECDSPKDEARLITQSVKIALKYLVDNKRMTFDESKKIMDAMKKSINNVLLQPKENEEFWQAYKQEKTESSRIMLLTNIVKEKMRPILYDAGLIEKLKRNVLIEVLGDFKASYKNTSQKEIGYQKLRSDYALRTVELRVGNIQTTDFDKATKVARVMDALGYLDTVNHITNHDLHDSTVFDVDKFFVNLVKQFESIHQAAILGSGKDPKNNLLVKDIALLKAQLEGQGKSEKVISRQVYQLIKDKVEKQLDSVEAFALSRAVEFNTKTLSADDLFKETYEEGFKRSGVFSKSNISGEQIFKSSTLHESLKNKSMFDLHKESEKGTRADKIFNALIQITDFKGDDSQQQDNENSEPAVHNKV
jgi:predicted acylesterase/phospholipase RssA